jgi:methyl-accepting chemotaxis protein
MSDDLFRIVVAGGVLLAALCALALAVTMLILLRAFKKMKEQVDPLLAKSGPILDIVHRTSVDVAPKIVEISTDAVEISKNAKLQVARVGELLTEFSDRAREKVQQIDRSVEQTISNVQHTGESVKETVLRPVREVNGVLAGIRTAFSVYSHGRRQSVDHATQDEEMFI